MIKSVIKRWEENKLKLEEYFKTTNQKEYQNYEDILRKIFEICINVSNDKSENFNFEKLYIIDDGDYQGTLIFIIPKNTYQPTVADYIVTDTYYGSCSGCDTLQGISCYNSELPSESQVKEYMTLSLHLIQKIRYIT